MTPIPKSLKLLGFQKGKNVDWPINHIKPLIDRANFNFPRKQIIKKDTMVEHQRAGNILRALETKYLRKLNCEFIHEIVTRKPLIVKNIGTPGNLKK